MRSTNFDAEASGLRDEYAPGVEIRSLAPGDDATAFRTLNEEWITQYFTLEQFPAAKRNLKANSLDSHAC